MAREYEYLGAPRRSSSIFGIVLALLLGAVALGLFVHHARQGIAGKLAALITGQPLTVVSAGEVVNKIQKLNRLETAVYTLDTVVEGSEPNPLLPDVLGGDKLLMIVRGRVVAGLDLSQLKPESVEITQTGDVRSIRLSLPPSQVFFTAVDDTHSRVYSRDTGIFVRADPNLETQTRARAQVDLQQAALSDGILDSASRNARADITALLQGLGFAHVDLR